MWKFLRVVLPGAGQRLLLRPSRNGRVLWAVGSSVVPSLFFWRHHFHFRASFPTVVASRGNGCMGPPLGWLLVRPPFGEALASPGQPTAFRPATHVHPTPRACPVPPPTGDLHWQRMGPCARIAAARPFLSPTLLRPAVGAPEPCAMADRGTTAAPRLTRLALARFPAPAGREGGELPRCHPLLSDWPRGPSGDSNSAHGAQPAACVSGTAPLWSIPWQAPACPHLPPWHPRGLPIRGRGVWRAGAS